MNERANQTTEAESRRQSGHGIPLLGGAGDEGLKWRYFQGKERMEELLGLNVVEMPHALASPDYVYNHPEARASDPNGGVCRPYHKGGVCMYWRR